MRGRRKKFKGGRKKEKVRRERAIRGRMKEEKGEGKYRMNDDLRREIIERLLCQKIDEMMTPKTLNIE